MATFEFTSEWFTSVSKQSIQLKSSVISIISLSQVIIPRLKNKPANPDELSKLQKRWENSTNDLETIWLKRSSYLSGNRITISDLLGKNELHHQSNEFLCYFQGVCEMMQPIAAGYNLDTTRFPRVQDWMDRVKKDTAPHFDQAHRIPMRLRETILKGQ